MTINMIRDNFVSMTLVDQLPDVEYSNLEPGYDG